MDGNQETLPDESGEIEYPALTEDDWRADLMVYMGYPDGDERHPGEFSMGEAMELYPHMSESGINKRLVALVKAGHYTRRRAIVNGHSVWLYRKAN